MYRVPKDLNLDDIIGSEVHQICLGRYDVQFHFHSGRSIRAQGKIQVVSESGKVTTWNDEKQWDGAEYQSLLGIVVEQYSVPNDITLEIRFCNGWTLKFYDDSDQFETMLIEPGTIVI